MGGCGRARIRDERSGRRESIVSAEGGRESGERRGCVRAWRRRVWYVRWDVRAMWAVARLWGESEYEMFREGGRCKRGVPYRVVWFSTLACELRSRRWVATCENT